MAKEEIIYLRKNGGPDRNKDECIFAVYCNKWLIVNSTRLKASSCAKYRTDIENHIIPFFGDKVPGEISSDTVDDFTWYLLREKNYRKRQLKIF